MEVTDTSESTLYYVFEHLELPAGTYDFYLIANNFIEYTIDLKPLPTESILTADGITYKVIDLLLETGIIQAGEELDSGYTSIADNEPYVTL